MKENTKASVLKCKWESWIRERFKKVRETQVRLMAMMLGGMYESGSVKLQEIGMCLEGEAKLTSQTRKLGYVKG